MFKFIDFHDLEFRFKTQKSLILRNYMILFFVIRAIEKIADLSNLQDFHVKLKVMNMKTKFIKLNIPFQLIN